MLGELYVSPMTIATKPEKHGKIVMRLKRRVTYKMVIDAVD